jgi:hypothetical protein
MGREIPEGHLLLIGSTGPAKARGRIEFPRCPAPAQAATGHEQEPQHQGSSYDWGKPVGQEEEPW